MEKNKVLLSLKSNLLVIGFLFVITGLAGFLRFHQIGKLSFWGDEIATYVISSGDFQSLLQGIKQNPNMSLYFILAHFWIHLFPYAHDGLLRALSALISTAGIPMLFLLAKETISNQKKSIAIGLLASGLQAINAYEIQYAQEFRSYSLLILLATISTLLLIKWVDNLNRLGYLVSYTFVAAAMVYAHFHAVFIIFSQAISLLLLLKDRERRRIILNNAVISLFGVLLLTLPIITLAFQDGTTGISWIQKPSFDTVLEFVTNITGNQGLILLIIYIGFLTIGLFYPNGPNSKLNNQDRWKLLLLASCLLLPTFICLIISETIVPVFMSRYLIYSIPFLSILSACGIVALIGLVQKRRTLMILLATIITVIFSLLSAKGITSYYANYKKEDWKKATTFLQTRCSESLILYYVPGIDMFTRYYDPMLDSKQEKLWRMIIKDYPNSDQLLGDLLKDYNQVCLVLGKKVFWETGKIDHMQSILAKEFQIESKKELYGVSIKFYEHELN